MELIIFIIIYEINAIHLSIHIEHYEINIDKNYLRNLLEELEFDSDINESEIFRSYLDYKPG